MAENSARCFRTISLCCWNTGTVVIVALGAMGTGASFTPAVAYISSTIRRVGNTQSRLSATACAVAGVPVTMVDISDAAVQHGIATITKSLDRLIKKEKLTEAQRDAALALIKGSTSYDDLKGADLVIEIGRAHV